MNQSKFFYMREQGEEIGKTIDLWKNFEKIVRQGCAVKKIAMK